MIKIKTRPISDRKGAVLPMFAILLPVLVLLCSFAINVAYMQLASTELKICTDVAAHAGGRAMSIHQSTERAWDFAIEAGGLNTVAGQNLVIPRDEEHLEFGSSVRANNGFGRYEFTSVSKSRVDNGTGRATSLAVTGELNFPLLFTAMPGTSSVSASRRSIATQVDRDIALVLDRSGSMLFYKDDDALTEEIDEILDATITEVRRYLGWSPSRGFYIFERTVTFDANFISQQERDNAVLGQPVTYLTRSGRITNPGGFYHRRYSSNLRNHLGNSNLEMAEYADDWTNNKSYDEDDSTGAPRHSRWALLTEGVERFLDVLEITDQDELVSLTTFSGGASVNTPLYSVYNEIRDTVEEISPFGGTAIGEGLKVGLPPIVNGTDGEPPRIFAAKTIVVLTDGENNEGTLDPVTEVQRIRGLNNVTIHTVTFTQGADQDAMKEVARHGGGRHYHADNGDILVEIFEEIANNLPTVLTE